MTDLQTQLDTITANTRRLVQPERLAIGERFLQELLNSGIEQQALQPGAPVPAFTLKDAAGRTTRSEDLLALGPVIVKFFRGRWDPYCTTELETWRDLYPAVRERGALLVAISPQTVRQNDFMVQQHGLPFPILSDPACQTAASFGIAYTLPDYMQSYYRSILVNIPYINGEQSWRLPLPATFILTQAGILFADAQVDFRTRTDPARTLSTLP